MFFYLKADNSVISEIMNKLQLFVVKFEGSTPITEDPNKRKRIRNQ